MNVSMDFICGVCKKIYKTQKGLNGHKNKGCAPPKKKEYWCQLCNIKFETNTDLQRHVQLDICSKFLQNNTYCYVCHLECGTHELLVHHEFTEIHLNNVRLGYIPMTSLSDIKNELRNILTQGTIKEDEIYPVTNEENQIQEELFELEDALRQEEQELIKKENKLKREEEKLRKIEERQKNFKKMLEKGIKVKNTKTPKTEKPKTTKQTEQLNTNEKPLVKLKFKDKTSNLKDADISSFYGLNNKPNNNKPNNDKPNNDKPNNDKPNKNDVVVSSSLPICESEIKIIGIHSNQQITKPKNNKSKHNKLNNNNFDDEYNYSFVSDTESENDYNEFKLNETIKQHKDKKKITKPKNTQDTQDTLDNFNIKQLTVISNTPIESNITNKQTSNTINNMIIDDNIKTVQFSSHKIKDVDQLLPKKHKHTKNKQHKHINSNIDINTNGRNEIDENIYIYEDSGIDGCIDRCDDRRDDKCGDRCDDKYGDGNGSKNTIKFEVSKMDNDKYDDMAITEIDPYQQIKNMRQKKNEYLKNKREQQYLLGYQQFLFGSQNSVVHNLKKYIETYNINTTIYKFAMSHLPYLISPDIINANKLDETQLNSKINELMNSRNNQEIIFRDVAPPNQQFIDSQKINKPSFQQLSDEYTEILNRRKIDCIELNKETDENINQNANTDGHKDKKLPSSEPDKLAASEFDKRMKEIMASRAEQNTELKTIVSHHTIENKPLYIASQSSGNNFLESGNESSSMDINQFQSPTQNYQSDLCNVIGMTDTRHSTQPDKLEPRQHIEYIQPIKQPIDSRQYRPHAEPELNKIRMVRVMSPIESETIDLESELQNINSNTNINHQSKNYDAFEGNQQSALDSLLGTTQNNTIQNNTIQNNTIQNKQINNILKKHNSNYTDTHNVDNTYNVNNTHDVDNTHSVVNMSNVDDESDAFDLNSELAQVTMKIHKENVTPTPTPKKQQDDYVKYVENVDKNIKLGHAKQFDSGVKHPIWTLMQKICNEPNTEKNMMNLLVNCRLEDYIMIHQYVTKSKQLSIDTETKSNLIKIFNNYIKFLGEKMKKGEFIVQGKGVKAMLTTLKSLQF